MRELVDKQLMLEDAKSWVAMDSYEQHLINNMLAWIENLPTVEVSDEDCISRRVAIETISRMMPKSYTLDGSHPADEEIFMAQEIYADCIKAIEILPTVQPERIWHSCKTPPKHHKDVLVRGTEAIGNVTTYKVMQWDVDAWRPTDYAPSIIWEEWSEI